jgi:outer membrane protein assembly factor BamB
VSYGDSRSTVARGIIYIGSVNLKVYALDAATGRLRWTYTTGTGTLYSPAVQGGTVYIGSTDHSLYALST